MTEETVTPAKRTRRKKVEGEAANGILDVLQQLQDAQAKVRELTEALEKAAKEATSAKSTAEYHEKQRSTIAAEMEQLHALMDVLPGCIGRETQTGDNSWEKRQNAAMTRLASWLAIR